MSFRSFPELKKFASRKEAVSPLVSWCLMGDSSTQFLGQALKGAGRAQGIELEIQEAPYDQIDQYLLSQEFAQARPQATVISLSPNKLWAEFHKSPKRSGFGAQQLTRIKGWIEQLKAKHPGAQVFLTTYSDWDDGVFGNASTRVEGSFLFQTRLLNLELMKLSAADPTLHLIDMNLLQSELGAERFRDPRMAYSADLQISLEATARLAQRIVHKWQVIRGQIKKCLILDLDNTTWGGIVADVGIEGIEIGSVDHGKSFTEFQKWAKQLRERGVLLAVCSKNDEQTARGPFVSHPEMVLRLEDISVFVANYHNKADNIRYIQKILNIGFDSMVFLDDSPFERGLVREQLPEVLVPELPEDPAQYMEFLRHLHLFETVALTSEDAVRTEQYREEAQRRELQVSFTDETEFLKSLGMKAEIAPLTNFNRPRVAQLSQRSNQFNLRTVRYTEDGLKELETHPSWRSMNFTLKDRFGEYGLISSLLLELRGKDEVFINTWIMSCRVLKRGVESLVLNEAVRAAQETGSKYLVGEYLPTSKNALVQNHYRDLGFEQREGLWFLDVSRFERRPHWIQITQQ